VPGFVGGVARPPITRGNAQIATIAMLRWPAARRVIALATQDAPSVAARDEAPAREQSRD